MKIIKIAIQSLIATAVIMTATVQPSAAATDAGSVQDILNRQVKLSNGKQVAVKDLDGKTPLTYVNTACGQPAPPQFGSGRCGLTAPAPITESSLRHPDLYKAIINQFGADSNLRYKYNLSYRDSTYCNTFAGDVLKAMGLFVPTKNDWGVLKNDLASIGFPHMYYFFTNASGSPYKAANYGWREVDATKPAGLNTLIAHVNAGKPAVAVNSGHISVIRPGQANVTSFKNLRTSQAGARNFSNESLEYGFGSSPTPRFFVHD